MSLVQESYVQSLLVQCDQLSQRQEREAREAIVRNLDKIYNIFQENVREAFSKYSFDVLVRFTQIAVENYVRFEQATKILELLLERFSSSNQFYIRALLVKAKVVAYTAHRKDEKGQEMMTSLKESIDYVSKALDLIAPQQEGAAKGKEPKGQSTDTSNKSRYAFLIYNASTTLYKVTRFMLRPGWQKSFAQIYERIYKLLEEVQQADHNWRCRFTMILYQCMYDAEKKADAFKVLDTLWEKTKNKPCDFQDSLFRLRCYLCKENNALAASIKKDVEGADPNGWKILQPLQKMRSGLVPEAQIEKQLMAIVNQISLGVLSNNGGNSHTQISPIMQERLAEAGRVALRFNIVGLAGSIVSYLGKTRQPNQRALILNEYNKAELLIKKKGDYVDKNTGMSMSMSQIKDAQIENRKEALRVMEKVMLINKKLNNAELIYEGAIIVWNIALPFLCPQYQQYAVKALDLSLSLIEQIDSNDHELRTKLHLQLISIYFGNDLMFSEVESNVFKAMRLDPSIPLNKLSNKPEAQEDPSLYTRPYHRYLTEFRQKVLLKTMQVLDPNPLDMVTQDLWTIEDQKSETTKIDMLQKCLKTLLTYEQPPFTTKEEDMLVEEQIKERKLYYQRQKLRSLKRKKLLAAEIAKLSFEWDLNDFAKKACQFVLADTWDVKNAIELIIAQGHCSLYMAQIKIDQIYQLNCEPLFDQEETGMTEQQKKEMKEKKAEVVSYLKKSLEYALKTQQSYLAFNGAICIWNNFLHLFRVNANDSKLRTEVVDILKDYFEAMRNILKQVQPKGTIFYDLDTKIQAFSNIGLVYARILQGQKQTAQVQKVCEDLLLTNLSPNTRKLINGIKARVSGGKAPTGAKQADPKKGAAPVQRTAGFNDTFILEIDNQLELIQNTQNKNELQSQIIKCFQALDNWKPNQQDETELQLHAQLWVKLARLASEEENSKMLKYALRCSQKALEQYKNSSTSSIPPNRLRWYSLAQFLSSGTLLKLVNPETQQNSSVEVLLFLSMSRAVEAAAKGFKCGINILVVDAGKQLWNVCSHLQESKGNRQKLEKPIAEVLGYLKELKEDSEPDLLLLLSQLFFKIAWENEHYKTGEAVADMMLDLLPKTMQRSVWEAKMGFMSKQGKNELQAISSIKEAEPSLQAKLWVKLARIAPNPSKQQAAYKKALEILKKQNSVEIVEVLIEYAQWQLRVGKEQHQLVVKNLQYAGNLLIAIEEGNDLQDEEGDDDQLTLNSHSRSRSHTSKRSASRTVKSSQREAKKDKKVTVSSKSKASRVSRMNRSGRGQKTVNNKNAKSVFSHREEDPNPQFLNCIHYERLFRIYTILASISKEGSSKISYALNACKQAQNLMKKSITTFNELQQNAAKLNEKDEKVVLKLEVVPETIEEWIKYEFPKEYLQKIDKVENTSFLGTSTLEKPELTYNYLIKLTKLMSSIGLDYETLPLNFLSKYLTKFILKKENYWLLEQLKLKKVLSKSNHPLENTVTIDFKQFTIKQQEVREQVLKAENQRSNSIVQNSSPFDYQATPNFIKPLTKCNYWFEVSQVLVEFGEVSTAKNYLNEALKCAKIMNTSDLIGKIHLSLCEIAYLEGEQEEAMKNLSLAHRLCKALPEWQKIVELASRIMIDLRKYDQLKSFLIKVISTTTELISQNERVGKEMTSFRSEVSELTQLALSVELSLTALQFRITIEENTKQNKMLLTKSLLSLQKLIRDNEKILWNVSNYQNIERQFKEIIRLYESRGGKHLIELEFKNFLKILDICSAVYGSSKEFSKNKNLKEIDGGFYNFLIEMQTKIGFLYVNCLCIQHELSGFIETVSELDQSEEGSQLVRTFIQTISKEVQLHEKPMQTELSSLEQSLSILNDIEAHTQPTSVHYPQLIAQQIFVHALKDPKSEECFELRNAFKGEIENRLSKYSIDSNCYEFQSKVYQALCLLCLDEEPAQYFEYLSKYQHASSIQSIFQFLKRKLKATHKFPSALRLIERDVSQAFKDTVLERQKMFSCITKHSVYEEAVKSVPKNSLQIVVQLNKTKTKMFVGIVESEADPANRKFKAKIKKFTEKELKNFKQLQEIFLEHKKRLIKTSFDDESKIEAAIVDSEIKMREAKNILEVLNGWWLKGVIESLKKPKEAPPPTNEKEKKGAKDQKKKGGKDEVAAYESPLPPAPSGIESVTFLLDEFFYSLPFEEMIPAEIVSTVTKDTSFFWNVRKLQQIGFQSQLNNSNGVGADKGRYFSYDFKNSEFNFKELSGQLSKGPDTLKFQGIDSTSKIPSLGDYSDAFTKPGFLEVYGNIDTINHIRFNSFVEYSSLTKLKLLVIHDCLNFPKPILNKHKDINDDGPTVLLEETQQALAIIANLLNVTVIKNRWICPPEQMMSKIKETYQSLGKGLYIGSVLRQHRKETDKMNDIFMSYIHGPAVIRL